MPDDVPLDVFAGLTPVAAVAEFERRCNAPYETLWITPTWFRPRRSMLADHLSTPVSIEEAEALRTALLKAVPLDDVIEWLREDPRESWGTNLEERRSREREEHIAPMRRQYVEIERHLWADPAAAFPPLGCELGHIHWFCMASQPGPGDLAMRQLQQGDLSSCPGCHTPATNLSWRFVELISPVDGAVEDKGWVIACDSCHLVVHNVFPRAQQRWQFEVKTGFSTGRDCLE